MKERIILHCDMNNFYASVECMKDPSLQGLPVAVCGDVEERHGIVLAKNYIAKSYGVRTAETIWQAKNKCPDLVVLPPDFREYVRISRLARDIYEKYTDMIEPFGLDECWLDVTGSTRLFGCGEVIAHNIREEIKRELKLTVSVGVSFNKIFAKLGSDMKKPDAVTVIKKESFRDMVWQLPVEELFGVGRKTAEKLFVHGIKTIGQLAIIPRERAANLLGKCGDDIWRYANGLDISPVVTRDGDMPDKSIGHGMTVRRDMTNNEEIWCIMLELCQEIGSRLYNCKKKARGVAIHVRDSKFSNKQWQKQLNFGIQSPFLIAKEAFSLFEAQYDWHLPVRAVSVTAIKLCDEGEAEQIDLFYTPDRRMPKIDMTVEELRERYGDTIIKNGCLVGNRLLASREVLDGDNTSFSHMHFSS